MPRSISYRPEDFEPWIQEVLDTIAALDLHDDVVLYIKHHNRPEFRYLPDVYVIGSTKKAVDAVLEASDFTTLQPAALNRDGAQTHAWKGILEVSRPGASPILLVRDYGRPEISLHGHNVIRKPALDLPDPRRKIRFPW